MFISESQLSVRYAETDQMGVAHHTSYLIWFEVGRTDLIRKMGMSYSQMEELGLMIPVIEIKCQYKSAIKYEDNLSIMTCLKGFTLSRVIFGYKLYKNGEDKLISEGESIHAITTREFKPINIKKYFPNIYDLFLRANQ